MKTDYYFAPKFAVNDQFTNITTHVEVLQNQELTPNQKILISFLLAGFQGGQGQLALLAGIEKRTVGCALQELAEKGFIDTKRKGLFNMYIITHEPFLKFLQQPLAV